MIIEVKYTKKLDKKEQISFYHEGLFALLTHF